MYRRFLSVRYFRTRLVNWLSVVGVMVGVAVMIVVWSVFTGFSTETRKAIRGTLADVELRPDGDVVPPVYPELERVLGSCPHVAACVPRLTSYVAHPFRTANSDRGTGDAFHFMVAVGVDWAREAAFAGNARRRGARDATGLAGLVVAAEDPANPFRSVAGAAKWGEEPRAYESAIFSLAFLRRFVGPHDAPAESFLGQRVDLALIREAVDADGNPDYRRSTLKVYVSAVYDSRERDQDLQRVILDRAALWELSKPVPPPGAPRGATPAERVPYTAVSVAVADYERAAASRDAIVAWLKAHGVTHVASDTWEDQRGSVLMAVNNEKMLLAIVIAFIGLLAGFTILATLTLTVIEKTRDIGVLLALGATAGGVRSVFLRSGVLIGTLGGLLGVLLGIGLTRALNPFRDWLRDATGIDLFPPDVYGFEQIPFVFDVNAMLWIAGGCMAVAFLASLLPAVRASRLDPVVALRHE